MAEPNAAWLEVLDQIEESLRRSLERVPEPPPPAKLGGPVNLARLDERLRFWQAYLDRTEDNAARVEELLAAEEAPLAEYRAALAGLRETLDRLVTGQPTAAPAPATAAASAPSPPAT
jgi:hypothetical protein